MSSVTPHDHVCTDPCLLPSRQRMIASCAHAQETVDRAESVAGEAAAAVLQYLDEPLVSTSLDVSTSSDASTSSRSQHASNTDGPSDRIDSAPGRPLLLCDWRSNPTASSAAAQPQPTHTPQPAEQSSRDMSAQDALNVLEQTEISVWQVRLDWMIRISISGNKGPCMPMSSLLACDTHGDCLGHMDMRACVRVRVCTCVCVCVCVARRSSTQ